MYKLSPLRTNSPLPNFVRPPSPEITPENVVSELSSPIFKREELRLISPEPVIEPIESSAKTEYVPDTTTAVESLKEPLTANVPALILV